MQLKVITSTEEFYNLKEEWERLQDQDPDVTYYSTYEFNKTWWDVYKEDKDKFLFIICIYNNGKVVAIAPFIIENKKKKFIHYNVLEFMGIGDYLGVILDRSKFNEIRMIREIFKTIEEYNSRWDKIKLTHIKHNSQLARYLLRNPNYNGYFCYLIECPILIFNDYLSFEEYKNKCASGSAKRHRNKLNTEVGYDLKVINNKYDYDIYKTISDLHKKEQKFLKKDKNKIERSSFFNDKKRAEFVKKIYEHNDNIITFVIEDKKGDIIIYETCYLYKKVLHSWNTAFEPKFEKYNVGRIINFEIMKYIFENDIADIFDFGTGRYPWKFEWTNNFIFDYQLDMWNLQSKKGIRLKKLSELKKKLEK